MDRDLSANYILNPLLEIKGYADLQATLCKEDDLNKDTISKLKKGKRFLLVGRKKDMLINDIIYSFLTQFITSNTLGVVSKHFAKKMKASVAEVLPTVDRFLEDMLCQGILIPIETLEEVLTFKASETTRSLVFPIGSIIKEYKILELIAEKKNFDLYLAEQLSTKRQVAIKTLYLPPEELETELKFRKKLLRQEFKLLQEVSGSTNVCEFISIEVDGNYAFGVMEYLEGQSLGNYIKKNQLNLSQKIALIQQVFDAVAYVHACGIVHGDIHKSNFLVNANGTIKLFDFDLANHVQLQKKEIERIGGVFKYFPPEKIRKNSFNYIKEKADYRSEVYQVGLIAYYILYERLPFKALSWRTLAKKIKKEQPVFEQCLSNQQEIPQPFIALLEKALSKKPKNRLKSVNSLHKKWVKAMRLHLPIGRNFQSS